MGTWASKFFDAPVARTRPEAELLLCAVSVFADSAPSQRTWALLQHDLDWNALVQMAHGHLVMPLLYWHLSRTCPGAVPPPILDQLRDDYRNNSVQNLFLIDELLTLLKLFEARAIGVLPFKGLTLAAAAYGNLALRQPGDLDLLVRPRDILGAKETLLARGFRPTVDLRGDQEAAYLRTIGQLPFVHPENGVMVELHTHLLPRDFPFALDFESLWQRRVPVALASREVPSLSPEDLLLLLCAHGTKHLWIYLKWICDVAQLLRACPAMDWPRVMREARRLGSERMLFLGLQLARDLLQAPLPDAILERARADAVARTLAGQVRQNLFRDRPPDGLELALFQFRVRERPRDGLRYALSLALTPTVSDWTALHVPASLSFVHYLCRPVRLAGKYGRLLLRRPES